MIDADNVLDIISRELELDDKQITVTDSLEQLGAASPQLLEIAIALEDEFEVRVPDSALAKFRTPADIIDFLKKLGKT